MKGKLSLTERLGVATILGIGSGVLGAVGAFFVDAMVDGYLGLSDNPTAANESITMWIITSAFVLCAVIGARYGFRRGFEA